MVLVATLPDEGVLDEGAPDEGVPDGGVLDERVPDGGSVDECGLRTRLSVALRSLSSVISELDPARLTGTDATGLYELLVSFDRLSNAGKTLLAPRIDDSGIWKAEGHRNAAVMLASLEGVATGQAMSTLSNGVRLTRLPGTEAALRTGVLSGPKLTELTAAGVLSPEREEELLEGAAQAPLKVIRDRCSRSRATAARSDPLASIRRIHAARHFTSWTDAEGAFCYQGKDTLDRGALILSRLQAVATRLDKERRSKGVEDPIPGRATRADAFYALLTARHPDSAEPLVAHVEEGTDRMDDTDGDPRPDRPGAEGSSLIDAPPESSVVVRVDLGALLRGRTVGNECCEIDNLGPIPVRMARDLANDSFLAIVFHEAGDIRAVSHVGRTINKTLRTALVHRDTTCVVPGCGTSYGLEVDHIVPFAEGGPTSLDNLALLCHHHHFLKTYEGWVLTRVDNGGKGTPRWTFAPQPPFGKEPGLGIDTVEGRERWRRQQE